MKKIVKNIITTILLVLASLSDGQIVYTVAGTGTAGYIGDGGAATSAQLNAAMGLVTDKFGNLYFAEEQGSRIRKVNQAGIITTIAGTGSWAFSGDGGLATAAEINRPWDVNLDTSGNIYIVDGSNHRVRKVSSAGIISTIAGNGSVGFSGDGGPATAAQFNGLIGITTDLKGNIYLYDRGNGRIRKINSSGIISTIAGTGGAGSTGDGGPAIAATFISDFGITVDTLGNIYFGDGIGKIRKINPSGIISTIAGNGIAGFSGDGGPATLAQISSVRGIVSTPNGEIYFTDDFKRIRKVNSAGIISTISGTLTAGFSGDGVAAATATINPIGITIDKNNNIYFSDGTYRVRVICQSSCLAGVQQFSKNENNIEVFPNPTSDKLRLDLRSDIQNGKICLINVQGQKIYEKEISQGENNLNLAEIAKGLYTYILIEGYKQIGSGKLSVE